MQALSRLAIHRGLQLDDISVLLQVTIVSPEVSSLTMYRSEFKAIRSLFQVYNVFLTQHWLKYILHVLQDPGVEMSTPRESKIQKAWLLRRRRKNGANFSRRKRPRFEEIIINTTRQLNLSLFCD